MERYTRGVGHGDVRKSLSTAGVALCLSAAIACRGGSGADAAADRARPLAASPPEVAFTGCMALMRDGSCELSSVERRLTLWSSAPGLAVRADGHTQALISRTPVADGERIVVDVPARTAELALGEWSIRIGSNADEAVRRESDVLREGGDNQTFRAHLRRVGSRVGSFQRAIALGTLARLDLDEGKLLEARDGLRASLQVAHEEQCISCVSDDATALAYLLIMELRDYAEARAVLRRAASETSSDPTARALIPHFQGLLARETGDLRDALRLFRAAARDLERLDLAMLAQLAMNEESSTLVLLGRHREALALSASFSDVTDASVCERLNQRISVVWLGLRAELTPGSSDWPLIATAAREADSLFAQCNKPWYRRSHLANRGLLALAEGDLADAERAAAALRRAGVTSDATSHAAELDFLARLELAKGHPQAARQAFGRARAFAVNAGLWDQELRAGVGEARAYELLAKKELAVESYLLNEQRVGAMMDGLPFGEGLAGFVREREAATRRLIKLLVDLERPGQALRVARTARARTIDSLSLATRISSLNEQEQERWDQAIAEYHARRAELEHAESESWQLPADRLPSARAQFSSRQKALLASLDSLRAVLAPAHARMPSFAPGSPARPLLGLFPVEDGWLGFVSRGEDVHARQLSSADPAVLRAWLLDANLLPDSEPSAILHGQLASFDLHALELDGRLLADKLALSYALDAPSAIDSERAQRALLVGDPSSDLPEARLELASIAASLGAVTLERLWGADATRHNVLWHLSKASLVHFAGHAQFAGLEGAESGLKLADGWLTVGDLLAQRASPALVTLSACEGASREDPHGIGIAQAFIAAGARAVIASTRKVTDVTARRLFQAFYRERAASPELTVAKTLQRAQQRLRIEQPTADWASFRVLTP